jgi:zinc and cadmium transporter
MPAAWIYALTSVTAVSLASLVGAATLWVGERALKPLIFFMVSLAVGCMLGAAFIHVLPESYGAPGSATAKSMWAIAGIFAFFILEKYLHWRHEHEAADVRPVGYLNLFADALCNLLDGVLIGAAFQAGPSAGIATTVAVLCHEIPQEISDFGVLLHAGFGPRKALGFNLLSASLAIAGTVLSLVLGAELDVAAQVLLPFSAGGLIYLAGSDLIPELHRERAPLKSAIQTAAIALGIGIMLLVAVLDLG